MQMNRLIELSGLNRLIDVKKLIELIRLTG